MDQINLQIATEVMGYEKGNFKCVDGRKFIVRDHTGYLYHENDVCFPDFYNNDSQCVEVLSRFKNWEIAKYSDSHYEITINHNNKKVNSIGDKLSKVICNAALLAVRI